MENDDPPPIAQVYIREWMERRHIENQKALAGRMKVGEGTVSKKFKEPEKIDVEWLSKFAAALNVKVPHLFFHPDSIPSADVEHRPRLDDLMAAAAGMTDKQIDGLLVLLLAGEPPKEPGAEDARAPLANSK